MVGTALVKPPLGVRTRLSAGYRRRLDRGRDAFVDWAGRHRHWKDPYAATARELDEALAEFVEGQYQLDDRTYQLAVHAVLEAQVRRPRLKRRLGTAWAAFWA